MYSFTEKPPDPPVTETEEDGVKKKVQAYYSLEETEEAQQEIRVQLVCGVTPERCRAWLRKHYPLLGKATVKRWVDQQVEVIKQAAQSVADPDNYELNLQLAIDRNTYLFNLALKNNELDIAVKASDRICHLQGIDPTAAKKQVATTQVLVQGNLVHQTMSNEELARLADRKQFSPGEVAGLITDE